MVSHQQEEERPMEITLKEIKTIVKQLKNSISAELEGIVPELIK